MSSPQLTTFSYVVLVLVGRDGAGPHDLVRYMRQGRTYWAAAESQYYAEPKRLARLGLLRAGKEPGRTGPRTRYELTDAGRAAVAAWVLEPVAFPRIQHEPSVRLLAADLLDDPAEVLVGLEALRAELDAVDADIDAAQARAADLPHRSRRLAINHRLSRRLVALHRDWLAEVEAELGV